MEKKNVMAKGFDELIEKRFTQFKAEVKKMIDDEIAGTHKEIDQLAETIADDVKEELKDIVSEELDNCSVEFMH